MNNQPPTGVSGKKLTLGVACALILLGGTLAYALGIYSQLDTARVETARAWRDLATHFDLEFRSLEREVALGVDAGRVPMEFGEQFRLLLDRFRTTGDALRQRNTLEELDRLIGALNSADTVMEHADAANQGDEDRESAGDESDLLAEIRHYNQSLDHERRLLKTWGGRLLQIFLKFDQPEDFQRPTWGGIDGNPVGG